jgi:hypothetical protein
VLSPHSDSYLSFWHKSPLFTAKTQECSFVSLFGCCLQLQHLVPDNMTPSRSQTARANFIESLPSSIHVGANVFRKAWEKRDDTTPQARSRALMQESAAALPPLTQVRGVEPFCRKRKRCRQRNNFRSPASQAMALPLELSGSAQPCLRGRGGPFGSNPLELRP